MERNEKRGAWTDAFEVYDPVTVSPDLGETWVPGVVRRVHSDRVVVTPVGPDLSIQAQAEIKPRSPGSDIYTSDFVKAWAFGKGDSPDGGGRAIEAFARIWAAGRDMGAWEDAASPNPTLFADQMIRILGDARRSHATLGALNESHRHKLEEIAIRHRDHVRDLEETILLLLSAMKNKGVL